MRTLEWDAEHNELRLIDQRLLPGKFEIMTCRDHSSVVRAIREMVVRGAPAIGATAAFGMALAGCEQSTRDLPTFRAALKQAAAALKASRPTAVNLEWALRQMLAIVDGPSESVEAMQQRLIETAQWIAEEDVKTNKRMAECGAALIDDGDTLIHHCNTGALAAVDWGTALGVIRMAYEQGKHIHVLVDETRPRLQGARLTAWELQQYGIPYEIISDGASGYFLRSGQAQKVFFGADRVAANGDVVNKIGTYMLSLAANANGVPVYAVMPTSTVDLSMPDGDHIPIEERDSAEVLQIEVQGQRVTPAGAKARNPAFDITPHSLITALVTEKGVVYPPFQQNLDRMMRSV